MIFVVPLIVMVLESLGIGSVPSIQSFNQSCPYILFISARRALSLAPAKYPVIVTNPIVPSIVSMVMTTMSSMRVKACLRCLVFFDCMTERWVNNKKSIMSDTLILYTTQRGTVCARNWFGDTTNTRTKVHTVTIHGIRCWGPIISVRPLILVKSAIPIT